MSTQVMHLSLEVLASPVDTAALLAAFPQLQEHGTNLEQPGRKGPNLTS